MNKKLRNIIIVVGILIAAIIVGNITDKKNKNVSSNKTQSELKDDASSSINQDSLNKIEFEENNAIVKSLKSKFVKKEDEFNKSIFFYHKDIYSKYFLNRNTIYACIREDGTYYLVSNYYGEDWVFHQSIQVKIDDLVLSTEELPYNSDASFRDNKGGVVWEVNNYVKNNNILKQIHDYGKESTVKIRFQGRQRYHDATLSTKDKNAIIESVKFADAYSRIWNKIGAEKI